VTPLAFVGKIPDPSSMTSELPSIGDIIAQANGQDWLQRYKAVRANPVFCCGSLALVEGTEDLAGVSNYSNFVASDGAHDATFYEIVNRWQVNYVCGLCALDGKLKAVQPRFYSDELMFADFYATRPEGLVILDVGCNTGLNLRRALKYSSGAEENLARLHCGFGIEYSTDSASKAKEVFGDEAIVQGDSAGDFIVQKKWKGKFDVAHFTAVAQHLTPDNLNKTLRNIALGLKPSGELLMTFKDAPTVCELKAKGMEGWTSEVFTSTSAPDTVSTDDDTESADDASRPWKQTKIIEQGPQTYSSQDFLTAVMWDDDYYPGVVGSSKIGASRDLGLPGDHKRKFNFYSLDYMKASALECGLVAESVEVHPDSKIPFGAIHWRVVFRKTT